MVDWCLVFGKHFFIFHEYLIFFFLDELLEPDELEYELSSLSTVWLKTPFETDFGTVTLLRVMLAFEIKSKSLELLDKVSYAVYQVESSKKKSEITLNATNCCHNS